MLALLAIFGSSFVIALSGALMGAAGWTVGAWYAHVRKMA